MQGGCLCENTEPPAETTNVEIGGDDRFAAAADDLATGD